MKANPDPCSTSSTILSSLLAISGINSSHHSIPCSFLTLAWSPPQLLFTSMFLTKKAHTCLVKKASYSKLNDTELSSQWLPCITYD